MSVSILWEVVKPQNARSFRFGVSDDLTTFKSTFGDTVCSTSIPTLRAMHAASSRGANTLWGECADILERLQGDDFDKPVSIKVWGEW